MNEATGNKSPCIPLEFSWETHNTANPHCGIPTNVIWRENMIRLESCCFCLNYTACRNSTSGFAWIHVRTFPQTRGLRWPWHINQCRRKGKENNSTKVAWTAFVCHHRNTVARGEWRPSKCNFKRVPSDRINFRLVLCRSVDANIGLFKFMLILITFWYYVNKICYLEPVYIWLICVRHLMLTGYGWEL
jgi:hypothetical protein